MVVLTLYLGTLSFSCLHGLFTVHNLFVNFICNFNKCSVYFLTKNKLVDDSSAKDYFSSTVLIGLVQSIWSARQT